MTDLQLITGPHRYRHRPTEIEAMQFTAATRQSLEAWLVAELGREHFKMTPAHLIIETTQGDRDIHLGGWVIKRPLNNAIGAFEFYPVEDEVMYGYELVPA